tara:strand:- start:3753 stop:4922 length:1170 start_codon:yes stop_codon:yes gene_type:complete
MFLNKIMRLTFTISCFFLFLACNKHKQNVNNGDTPKSGVSLNFVENREFESGFSSQNIQIEVIDKEEYICFSDFFTSKKIHIYNLKTEEEIWVDLKTMIDFGFKIAGIEILSLDTILVLTQYRNQLFFLNRDGVIWKYIDFNPQLEEIGGYELWSGKTPFMFNDTTAIFPISLVAESEINKTLSEDDFYKKYYSGPNLFKVDNIFDEDLNCNAGLYDLYNNFTDKYFLAIEGKYFTYLNDFIYFFSNYSDTIYQVDPVSLKLVRKVKINSTFGKAYMKPVTRKLQKENNTALNSNFKENMSINSIVYITEKEQYWVVVRHAEKEGSNRPWSVVVLDSAFNELDEFTLDHDNLNLNIRSYSDGLFIPVNRDKIQKDLRFKVNVLAQYEYE